VLDSPVDSIFGEFPQQLDILNIRAYRLSMLSASIFLFLSLFNLPKNWV
jgi:hypothetical protein